MFFSARTGPAAHAKRSYGCAFVKCTDLSIALFFKRFITYSILRTGEHEKNQQGERFTRRHCMLIFVDWLPAFSKVTAALSLNLGVERSFSNEVSS